MKDFLKKNIDKPVNEFINNNPELSVALAIAGLGTAGYLFHRSLNAGKEVKKTWDAYNKKYKDFNKSNIEKIRRASGLGLKADYVKPVTMQQLVGTKDNAFFLPKDSPIKGFPGLKTDNKTDKKFGHVYYTDSTKNLPVLAHEYGHGESAYKGEAPSHWGTAGRGLLALAAGLGTHRIMNAIGFGMPSSLLTGALATAATGYIADHYTVDEEERASNNARRYLKALKHSNRRLEDDDKVLDAALETYKEGQRGRLIGSAVSPVIFLGLASGIPALLNKYLK